MRKGNKVSQLNRRASHRKAMMSNMATSLFEHERIVTTRARGKALRGYAEKLITRARKNLADDVKAEQALHNKRMVMRFIKDRDIVVKLFTDIASRFKDRNGGYIRLIHLPPRASDSSEMSIVELVDRKEKAVRKKTEKKKPAKKKKDDAPEAKKDEKTPWYRRFRSQKGPE